MNQPRIAHLQPMRSSRIKHYPQVCPIILSLLMLALGVLSMATQFKLKQDSLFFKAGSTAKAAIDKDITKLISGIDDTVREISNSQLNENCLIWPSYLNVYNFYVGYWAGAVLALTGLFGLLAPIVKIEAMPAFKLVGCLISFITLPCQAAIAFYDIVRTSGNYCGHCHIFILFISALVSLPLVFIASTIACHFVCCNCCASFCCPCLSPKELRSSQTTLYHDLQNHDQASEMAVSHPV